MNYRETQNAYCNCEKHIYSGAGLFDIPEIFPQEVDLSELKILSFNYAKGEKSPQNYICHFYVDDYQFDRVWRNPKAYVPLMRKFKAVLAPDFSIYDDFPVAVNIFNHYRKHWVARYWQEHGITVIPTICWGDEASLEWCLDGEPRDTIISTSCVGCNTSKERSETYWKEYKKVMRILRPKCILLYKGMSKTNVPDIGINTLEITSNSLYRLKHIKRQQKGGSYV